MSGLPIEVSVSVKADVLKLLEQNGIMLKTFIEMKNLEPPVAIEVGGFSLDVCKMTGSLESIEAVRKALKAEMQKISTMPKTDTVSSQFHAAFSTREVDKAENSDVRTIESKTELESNENSDSVGIPASSSSMNEVMVSEKCPKRVRKLKISEPKPLDLPPPNTASTPDSKFALQSEEKNALGKDIISQSSSMKAVLTNEEIISLVKADQLVEVVVEKENHNYMMMQFKDDINKYFTNIFEYEEDGRHKVALELKVNTRSAKADAIKRYNSYLGRFCCETYQLSNSVESSVLESVAGVAGIEHVSIVVCDDNRSFKLFGSKKDIELMKLHIKKQLDYGKQQDGQWQCASGKKKRTKKAAYHFVMKDGKAFPVSMQLSESDRKSSLEVKFVEWKNELAVDILVVAVDSKMTYDKDRRTVQLPTDLKSFLNSKNVSLMNLVPETAPKDLKKIRKILHIVLMETFDENFAADVVTLESRLKDGIIKCINYANKEKYSTLAIPLLCPGFCDVDTFIHQAVEALKSDECRNAQKSASLNSVIFVAKNSDMKQEMAEKFASLFDKPDD